MTKKESKIYWKDIAHDDKVVAMLEMAEARKDEGALKRWLKAWAKDDKAELKRWERDFARD
jgi:hypothetical protein